MDCVAAISDELLARRRSDVSRPQHLSSPGIEVRPRLGTDRPRGDESRDRTPATRDLQRLTLLDAVQNRANLALQLADGHSFHLVHHA